MTVQLCVLFSDKARSFNRGQRALVPNFVIINHSPRQHISHLPRPKFSPHNLGCFLLFFCRSPKNRLKYRYRHNFFLYSPFLVLHSPLTVPRSLSPFLYSLFHVPCSLFPVSCFFSCFLFPVSCFLFPVSCFLFPVPCSLFPVPCFLFFVRCWLLPVSCSLFTFSLPRSLFPVLRLPILIFSFFIP